MMGRESAPHRGKNTAGEPDAPREAAQSTRLRACGRRHDLSAACAADPHPEYRLPLSLWGLRRSLLLFMHVGGVLRKPLTIASEARASRNTFNLPTQPRLPPCAHKSVKRMFIETVFWRTTWPRLQCSYRAYQFRRTARRLLAVGASQH